MKNQILKENAITLIVLVISIIVLIILAGVSIAMLVGENGIITQAQRAARETEEVQVEEQKQLAMLEASIHLEEYEYTDANGEKVNIPAQCAVSKVEGENTLENGLVIIDINGNEWVWIEVPKATDIYQTAGLNITNFTEDEYKKIYEDLENYTQIYRDSDSKGTIPGTDEWYDGCGLTSNEYTQLKQKMLKSVYENEGFYIGRYEVGIKEENMVRYYGEEYDTEHPIDEIPVIQKDKVVYNWVTTSQAQELSEKLAVGGKTSSLMFALQWNLILKYIETKGEYTKDGTNTLINQALIKLDSTKWGNHSNAIFNITNINAKYSENLGESYKTITLEGYQKQAESVLLTTGALERNNIAEIYDLSGNVDEWTLEKTTNPSFPCNARGGNYTLGGFEYPVSCRGDCATSSNISTIGFRPALY